MIKPSRPEIGNWNLNVAKNHGSGPKPKVTFDMLFDKYSKQKAVVGDSPEGPLKTGGILLKTSKKTKQNTPLT
jgi:hypothetical protein